MANLDSLDIRISASATQAVNALTSLEEALKSLGNSIAPAAMGLEKISIAIDQIAAHKADVAALSKSIDVLSKSWGGLTTATTKAGADMDNFSAKAKTMAQTLASEWGIKSRDKVLELTNALNTMYSSVGDTVSIGKALGRVEDLIKGYSRFKVTANESSQALRQFLNEHNIKITEAIAKTNEFQKIFGALGGKISKNGMLPSEFVKEFNFMRSGDLPGLNKDYSLGEIDISGLDREEDILERIIAHLQGAKQETLTFADVTSKAGTYAGTFGDKTAELNEVLNNLAMSVGTTANTAFSELAMAFAQINTVSPQAAQDFLNLDMAVESLSDNPDPLRGLIDGLTELSTITLSDSLKNLEYVKSAASKFSGKNVGEAGQNLTNIASALRDFPMPEVGTLPAFTDSLYKLGMAKVEHAFTNLIQAKVALEGFKGLVIDPSITQSIQQLGDGLYKFGLAKMDKAVANLPALSNGLRTLIASLANMPAVSENTIRLVTALGNMNVSGSALNQTLGGIGGGLKRYHTQAISARKASMSLASAFGKMYANFFIFFRLIRRFGKDIDLASQLTEIQNVVDVTFAQMSKDMNDFSKTAIETLGMGELTAKQIGSRFQAMGNAMGISPAMVKSTNDFVQKATAGYANVANSIGDVSINLTRLAGDMASFYNMDYLEVSEDLEAVYTGITKSLRKYGLDLSVATLQQWALNNGMNVNIKTMTQAEKTLLRYQYVMAQTTAAHGDFIRTQNTWANQVRIATEKLNQLRIVLGKIAIYTFKPLVQNFNKAMDQILKGAEGLLNALGKIFGWQVEWSDGGVLRDEADDADDLADGMGDAADNAKKFKNFLLGIDELNLLPDNSDNDKGGAGGLGDLAGDMAELGKFNIKPVEKGFESLYDTLYKLGKRINEVIGDLLDSIDWDKVYKKARRFGGGLADFLNGLLSNSETFYKIGRFFANGLNAIAHSLDEFHKRFDGFQFGVDIGSLLNGFMENLDWGVIQSAAVQKAHDLAQTINGAFLTVDWKQLGKTIAEGLNTAIDYFYTLGKEIKWTVIGSSIAEGINGFFTNFDFVQAAETLNLWAKGLLDAIVTALDRTDWEKVGNSIGDFIANIDVLSIVGKFTTAFFKALNGAFSAWSGLLDTAPLETALATALAIPFSNSYFRKTFPRMISGFTGKLGKEIFKDLQFIVGRDSSRAGQNILNTFIKGFMGGENLVNITSSNFFTDVAGGFNAISASLSTATKAIGGITVGLGEFFTIKDSVYDLVRGTDQIGESIAKIVGVTTVAGTALSALLGFPAGLLATLAVGAVAGVTGIIKGFMDNQLEAFNNGVINALTVPDGANLYDYMKDLTENVRFAADDFNGLANKASAIADMKDSIGKDIEEIDFSIQKIDLSLKAQIELLPEDIQTIVNQFKGLNDDLRSVLSESYDIIVGGLGGWSDELASAFDASKPEILSAIHSVNEDVVKELDDLDSQIAELQASFDAGDLTTSQFYESLVPLIDRQNEIRASLGLVKDSVADFQKEVNGIDLSTLFAINGDGALELSENFIAADEALRNAYDNTIQTIEDGGNGVIEALNVYKDNAKDLDTKATIQKAITIEESDIATSKADTLNAIQGFYGDMQKQLLEGYDGVIEAAQKEYSNNIIWYHILGLDEGDVVSDALKDYEEKQIKPFAEQIRQRWGDVFGEDTIFVDTYAKSIRDALFNPTLNGGTAGGNLANNYKAILEQQLSQLPDVAKEYSEKTSAELNKTTETYKQAVESVGKIGGIIGKHDRELDGSKKKWADWGDEAAKGGKQLQIPMQAMLDLKDKSTLFMQGMTGVKEAFDNTVKSGEGMKTVSDNMMGLKNILGQFGTALIPVKTGFMEFTTQTQAGMNLTTQVFGQSFASIMKYGNQTISWLKSSFVPYFSGAYWNSITASIPNAFGNAFRQAVNIMTEIWKSFAKWANDNMKMNVKVNGKDNADLKVEVPQYATGGFPEDGLFAANHGELIGSFANGKTAVANNDQIVEGIKQGVYEAVVSAMQGSNGNVTVELRGDASDIFTAVVRENNRSIMRTGASPIRV